MYLPPCPLPRQGYKQKEGVGTLLYYLVEALDCPTVNNKQNPRQTIYSTPQTGIYITLTWAFLAHYPHRLELSRFQQGIIMLNALNSYVNQWPIATDCDKSS